MEYFNENDSNKTIIDKMFKMKYEFFELYKLFEEKSKIEDLSNKKMNKSNAEFFRSIIFFMNHWELCLSYEPEGNSYKMEMTNKRWRRNLYISYSSSLQRRDNFDIPLWLELNKITQLELEMIIMEFGE